MEMLAEDDKSVKSGSGLPGVNVGAKNGYSGNGYRGPLSCSAIRHHSHTAT